MIIYACNKRSFIKSVEEDRIANDIRDSVLAKMGRHTGISEYRSWENSMQHMYKVLNDPEIPDDSGIAIEYNIR